MAQPRYAQIKSHLLRQIEQGELPPGTKVASENRLSQQFSVSRMTAKRALDDLADAGFLIRSQGLGTFVADSRPMSSMLQIRNIADEIRERGHQCQIEVVALEQVEANEQQAHWLGLKHPVTVFHSVLVFLENGRAIQYEDRYVNPQLAPEYVQQDFSSITPNEYLSQVAPLTEADHIVEALLPTPDIAQQLAIAATQPCLNITRRTFSKAGIVSFASLIHPGDRYRLGGHIHVASHV